MGRLSKCTPLRSSRDHRSSIFSLEGGLGGLPLRVSNEGLLLPSIYRHTFHPRESPDCPSLRASDEHSFIVRVLRARRMVWWLPNPILLRPRVHEHRYQCSLQARSFLYSKGGLVDPRMRASNEGLLMPRVTRARGRPGHPSGPTSTHRHSSPHQIPPSSRRIPPALFPNIRLFESVCKDAAGRDG